MHPSRGVDGERVRFFLVGVFSTLRKGLFCGVRGEVVPGREGYVMGGILIVMFGTVGELSEALEVRMERSCVEIRAKT